MNHTEAVRDQLVERYFLDELEPAARDSFEEHYFSCAECAQDVSATAAFQENARAVLREKVAEPRRSWLQFFSWLPVQPAWAMTALLLVVTSWQSAVRIPALQQRLDRAESLQVVETAVLRAETRGTDSVIKVSPGSSSAVLVFDVNTALAGDRCTAEIRSDRGAVVFSRGIACPAAGTVLHLLAPVSSLEPGAYSLTIGGQSSESLGPYRFTLEKP